MRSTQKTNEKDGGMKVQYLHQTTNMGDILSKGLKRAPNDSNQDHISIFNKTS